MKKATGFILTVLLSTSLAFAQGMADGSKPQGENLKTPRGWEWRFDSRCVFCKYDTGLAYNQWTGGNLLSSGK